MAAITKPVDINKIWSASGDILAPSDTKISQGWGIEIPPRQYFNYIDNKQDKAIAHLNQYGVAQWDALTEYQFSTTTGKSLVMGSNGVIYRAKQVNTNQNPVTDTANTYWEVAFISNGTQVGPTVATAPQSRAQTDNTVFISPLQLSNAFTGAQQSLTSTGHQTLPGGLKLNWGITTTSSTGDVLVTFESPFTTAVFAIIPVASEGGSGRFVNYNSSTLSGFNMAGWSSNTTRVSVGSSWLAIGI